MGWGACEGRKNRLCRMATARRVGVTTHRKIAIVEDHFVLRVRGLVREEVRNPSRVERRRTTDDAVDGVPQLDQVLCQVGTILPGDPCTAKEHRVSGSSVTKYMRFRAEKADMTESNQEYGGVEMSIWAKGAIREVGTREAGGWLHAADLSSFDISRLTAPRSSHGDTSWGLMMMKEETTL
jgi:hypothetical protein